MMSNYALILALLLLTLAHTSTLKPHGLAPGTYIVDSDIPSLKKLSTKFYFTDGRLNFH